MPDVRVLVVTEPSGVERVVPLDKAIVLIGREPASTIRLESPYVSRSHARIEVQDDHVALIDLGSRNGCLLNGVRVNGSSFLHDTDLIAIGDVTIRCLAAAATGETTRHLVRSTDEDAAPIGALRVDARTYDVRIGDQPLGRRLSAQEFDLLRHLYEQRDRVCKRKELGDAVWGAGKWDTNMLHKLVHRLKAKVEPDPDNPRYIQTVPWVGYRLLN